MRKNKLTSPSSKPLLKSKNQNTSKNKLNLKTGFNSGEKYPLISNELLGQKVLSPRNVGIGKKSVVGSINKTMQGNLYVRNNLDIAQIEEQNIKMVCQNVRLIKALQTYGVKNSKHVIFCSPLLQPTNPSILPKNIMILSTLEEFTSIYVNLLTALDINVSPTTINKKIRWFIQCDAINSKNIEKSFKETYKNFQFFFFRSILSFVNLINLTIHQVIRWEASKNKFQLKNGGNQTINQIHRIENRYNHKKQSSRFSQVVNLTIKSFTNKEKTQQTNLSNDIICIKEQQICEKDELNEILQVSKVYICEKRSFQQYLLQKNFFKFQSLTGQQAVQNFIQRSIYLNDLEILETFASLEQLLELFIQQNKFYFFHLADDIQTQFKNPEKVKHLNKLYQIERQNQKLIDNLLKSQNLFFRQSSDRLNFLVLSDFNTIEIIKIMNHFTKEKVKLSQKQIVFLLLQPSSTISSQNTEYQELSSPIQNDQKFIFINVAHRQTQNEDLVQRFQKYFKREMVTKPLFFVVSQSSQKKSEQYVFQKIILKDHLSRSMLKQQVIRRLNYKKMFEVESLKNISKKVSVYGIKSSSVNQHDSFIVELCHFLGVKIQILTQNAVSSQKFQVKTQLQKTNNKINILFGKITNQEQKNEIFRSSLVIYLPKVQKLSLQKLVSTIRKAYEKYFNLFDLDNEDQSIDLLKPSIFIFNISNFSISPPSDQDSFSSFVQHFRLNQFQSSLKSLSIKKSKRSAQKAVFYFIFKMQEFDEDYEKVIDNARMKNDCQIQIYLKYGQEFIYRPKNGKYNFIKAKELKNKLRELIETFKKTKATSNRNLEENSEKNNRIQEINKVINEGVIQQSPRKNYSFIITPVKKQQKSTYSPNHSLIEEINQSQCLQAHLSKHSEAIFVVSSVKSQSKQKKPKQLYVFVHKTMPLKCLMNRNQAKYEILTYNQPSEHLLMASFLDSHEYVVVLKKKPEKSSVNEFIRSINSLSSKSQKTLLPSQIPNKKFKVIELKEMSEKQVTTIIDSLISQLKLSKVTSTRVNNFVNEIPLIVYQSVGKMIEVKGNYKSRVGKDKTNFQSSINSVQKKKITPSNIGVCAGSSDETKNQYFMKGSINRPKGRTAHNSIQKQKMNTSQKHGPSIMNSFSISKNDAQEEYSLKKSFDFQGKQSSYVNQAQTYEGFIKELKTKAPFVSKYFLTISQKDFVKLYQENEQKFANLCESIGISLHFLGEQEKLNLLKKRFIKLSQLPISHLSSPKQLLIQYFDPYIKPFDKASITNRFKISVSYSLIISRLIDEQAQKKKIPQRLWNMSSRSQKSLSSTSIKIKSSSKLPQMSTSNASSQTSLKFYDPKNQDSSAKKASNPSPVLNYYYSKQLVKEQPLKTYMNLFKIIASSGIREMMRKQKMAFKKVKITEFFTCNEELMTIMWENGDKKLFLIVLITSEEVNDLLSNVFFVSSVNLNLKDSVILQASSEPTLQKTQNESISFLKVLLNRDQTQSSTIMTRPLRNFQESIQQIQTKVQHNVAQVIDSENLTDTHTLTTRLQQQKSRQHTTILNHPSPTNHRFWVILCFIEDYEYLHPLIDSIIYKPPEFHQPLKLILQKAESIQQALNLNTQLLLPRCIILPSEWPQMRIGNGIMIDYNLQHFQRKLGIFLNNVINMYQKKDRFAGISKQKENQIR